MEFHSFMGSGLRTLIRWIWFCASFLGWSAAWLDRGRRGDGYL